MADKSEIKIAIAQSEQQIEELEKKRLRSQSALLEAYLMKAEPDQKDVDYFKVLTSLIRLERDNIRKLQNDHIASEH